MLLVKLRKGADIQDQNQTNDNIDTGGGSVATAPGVTEILAEVDFPASREELIVAARDADADDATIVMFQTLEMRDYESPDDVTNAMGETGDITGDTT